MRKFKEILPSVALSLLTVLCFGAAGEICGPLFDTTPDAFENKFSNNDERNSKQVLGKIKKSSRSKLSLNKNLVVMRTKEPVSKIGAWNITTGQNVWEKEISINSRLYQNEGTVMFQSGDEVVGIVVATGRELWRYSIPEGWKFFGSDIVDNKVAITLGIGSSNDGGYANGKIVLLESISGRVLWSSLTQKGLLGKPVIVGNYVFLPWEKKKFSVLNIGTGVEVNRIGADDYTINFITRSHNNLFYGSNATSESNATLFRYDKSSTKGQKDLLTSYTFPGSLVPGDPGFGVDGFSEFTPKYISYDYFLADTDSKIVFNNNRMYLHYWRYIICFDAENNDVLWAHIATDDIVKTEAVLSGIWTVDVKGKISFIDEKTGDVYFEKATSIEPVDAYFQLGKDERFNNITKSERDAINDLYELIGDNDNRLLPIKLYAINRLASFDDPKVTKMLLDLFHTGGVPVKKEVAKVLAKRKTGGDFLLNALAEHYDFIKGTTAPPVDVLVPVLVDMKLGESVPLLLEQLWDYETPVEYIKPIADAFYELGDESISESIFKFVTMYHADTYFVKNEEALARLCEVVFKYSKEEYTTKIENMRDGSRTLPGLKKLLIKVIDPMAEEKALARKKKLAEEKALAEAEALRLAKEQEIANRPSQLTRAQIKFVISKGSFALRPCVKDALEYRLGLNQIRMKFVLAGKTGKSSGLKIMPDNIPNLEKCLDVALKTLDFPKFSNISQSATHTIKITGVRKPPKKK